MDNLPQELINRIVWFTERYPGQDKWYPAIGQSFGLAELPSQFPRLAILNRLWKEAVETITFRHLGIKSDDLDTLQSIVTGNRRKYLAKISYTVLLPEYSYEACARVESRDEQRLNDEAFTKGIYDLFAALKTWEDDAVSPTDYRISGPKWGELSYDIAIGKRIDILYHRWEKSRLHFLKPDMLPVLSNVQHLNIDGDSSRELVPRIAPDLAMSLPNLRNVEWVFQDCDAQSADESSDDDSLGSDSDEEPYNSTATSPQVRSANRVAFADALRKVTFKSRSSACITFYHNYPTDQRRTGPSILPSMLTYDPFSATLRTFSQNLTALTLSAYVDSTLFWPSPDEENAVLPTWPHLKTLDITFDMVTPSGDWYFTGTRPPDHEDDDVARGIVGDAEREYCYMDYRVHPDPDTFDPFLAAFAKAVANMPVLEYFMLTSELSGATGKFHISYHAPGKKAEWGDEDPEDFRCRRVYYACEVGKVWVPEPETAQGLRGAGSEKFGGEVIERYLRSLYY
ncbi:hypothetical protein EJ02DRAFT_437906 [Clathrospora elynae]|uniref:F-box domain-containing protein n=1 Tax=Clathrospora elynae TaxID=706981 RepID=A0A6A5SCH0_9PLEO|nr:hypothetical protein EJ02DRAFT_437906 [Clathrospora elynae]